jgi:hypothetical protein
MDAQIIDLGEIAAACGPLADWWNEFVATGEPRLSELERARRSLRRLEAVPGSIGRAVRKLDVLGDEPEPADLIDAVELLCNLAHRHVHAPTPPRPQAERRPRKPRLAPESAQLLLPGLDGP